MPDLSAQPGAQNRGGFASTQWSMVLQARGAGDAARQALAELCSLYWYPLYLFIRRQGFPPDQVEDLTQDFFTQLFEKDFLQAVDRERGRFRAFLLACCRHFLANQRDRAQAQKRGGGRRCLSLDIAKAENRYCHEPPCHETAEKAFERRWALTLLEHTLDQLQEEYRLAGNGLLFDRLKPCLVGAPTATSYHQIAAALTMTEDAVKKAAQRLRQRYRAILREHIAATVEGPDLVDDEIRDLFSALAT